MMEYHFVVHLGGHKGRDMTMLDMTMLTEYLEKIRAVRYVACVEPATHDHLHCVYELSEARPQIKRDLLNAIKVDIKDYPSNATYNKKLKVGQTFELLAGGYLQKGYKFIKTYGVDHVSLEEGREEYTKLKERKTVRLSKHNLVRHIAEEMEDQKNNDWRAVMMLMMRDTKYNFSYVIGAYTEYELETLIHWKTIKSSSDKDAEMFARMFKEERTPY